MSATSVCAQSTSLKNLHFSTEFYFKQVDFNSKQIKHARIAHSERCSGYFFTFALSLPTGQFTVSLSQLSYRGECVVFGEAAL